MMKLVLFMILFSRISSSQWNYEEFGPDVWPDSYPDCKGTNQSPINIKTKCTVYEKFPKVNLSPAHNSSMRFTLTNNGHTIVGKAQTEEILSLSGSKLDGFFLFDSFHLHWGPNSRTGSEHQLNGQKYPGESHFVYKNIENNRTAVLAFFMKIVDQRSSIIDDEQVQQWKRYFDVAHQLHNQNDSQTLTLTLNELINDNLDQFWRYNGSLTTPPCTENVIWTIFRSEIVLLSSELESFRHDLFFESYRGPQPLFYRTVYQSFSENIVSPIPDQNCCINCSSTKDIGLLVLILVKFICFYLQ